jgi:hypothetical protein
LQAGAPALPGPALSKAPRVFFYSGSAGVWGDGTSFDGVLGTADGGIAVHAHNSSDTAAALQAENDSSESGAIAFQAQGQFFWTLAPLM